MTRLLAPLLIVTAVPKPPAPYDPISRHARLAIRCGEILSTAIARARPSVERAAEVSGAHARRAVAQARAHVAHALNLANAGPLEERRMQNLEILLATDPRRMDPDAPARAEVEAVNLVLNRALRALEPARFEDVRIIFRDVELTLFTGDSPAPVTYPARQPIFVERWTQIAEGPVPRELLTRLLDQARNASVRRLHNEAASPDADGGPLAPALDPDSLDQPVGSPRDGGEH